jgi:hypothetical protein
LRAEEGGAERALRRRREGALVIFIQFVILPVLDERPDDIVGVEYFAKRSGLSERTIRNGKAGTRRVPRARRRPLGWLRRDVDEFLTPKAGPSPEERAARLVDSTRRKRGRHRA